VILAITGYGVKLKPLVRLLRGCYNLDYFPGVRKDLIDPRYQATLDYIYNFIDYERMHAPRDASGYDLRRMYELLEGIGSPHLCAPVVHVAGTKGKGSTAVMIHAILDAAGQRTGLYTSPHLNDLRERIRVGHRLISETELMTLTERLKPKIAAVNRRASYGLLTTFEVLTTLAFAHFKDKQVDWQVLEVGLGGRLDATNVIIPEVAVITSISRDHTDVLGNELAGIAAEKAGIIKPGRPVVTSPQTPEVMAVLEEICRQRQAPLIKVGQDITWHESSVGLAGQNVSISGRLGSYHITIPLLGRHQQQNAAVAIAALEVLTENGLALDNESIRAGMAAVRWPGRLQLVHRDPLIVVDGAHNPDAAHRLYDGLVEFFGVPASGATLILGASIDKDAGGVIDALSPLFDRFIATGSQHPRAMTADALRDLFAGRDIGAEVAADIPTALRMALQDAGKRLICATGSLFVAGEVLEAVSEWPGYLGFPVAGSE
jgi:dihydrofolate synthase / folylpolyglutamate synthase